MSLSISSFRFVPGSVFCLFSFCLVSVVSLAQGPLLPAAGPEPTMLALDEVEPRTPIKSLPYDIVNPGSYYLTEPLTATNQGIAIYANNVSLDLMGFALTGSSVSNSVGIHVRGNTEIMVKNIVIRNGTVEQFYRGLQIENTQGGHVDRLIVANNIELGMYLRRDSPSECSNYIIENCNLINNGSYGMHLSTSLYGNRNHVIRNNAFYMNGGNTSLLLTGARGCLIDGNHFGPQNSTDTTTAIHSFQGNRNIIVRNTAQGMTNAFLYSGGIDVVGPIVTAEGYLSATGAVASGWANFNY